MRDRFLVPVSRQFCGGLCVHEGGLTSLDLALWLGAMSTALTLEDEPDANGGTVRDAWIIDDAASIFVVGKNLLRATGLRTHGALRRPFARLAESTVSIGLRGDERHRLWHGWEASPVERGTPVECGMVSGLALSVAMIHGDPWPVFADVRAMARFGSRYSSVVYLRALAWLAGAGTPRRWDRSEPGERVTLTIPMEDLHRALGFDLGMSGEWNERAFGRGGESGPVHRDLATAGIGLRTEWKTAYTGGSRKVPVALKVTVTRLVRREARQPTEMLRRRPRQSRSSASSAP